MPYCTTYSNITLCLFIGRATDDVIAATGDMHTVSKASGGVKGASGAICDVGKAAGSTTCGSSWAAGALSSVGRGADDVKVVGGVDRAPGGFQGCW